MRYVIQSTGQQVEVPLLPGLTLRGDQWYARHSRQGFKKTQILENAAMAKMVGTGQRPASSAAARVSGLTGPGALLAKDVTISAEFSPRPPSTSASRKTRSRPCTAFEPPHGPSITEAAASFSKEAVGPLQRPGVLRFAAYFTESTEFAFAKDTFGEPVAGHGMQVRKCFVLYHLEDATVEIQEERAMNSGVAGGRFYNRAPPSAAGGGWRAQPPDDALRGVPEAAAGNFGPSNLIVGGELFYLGQCFHLIDADSYTRKWYEENVGVDQPSAVNYPALSPRAYVAEHSTGLIADPASLNKLSEKHLYNMECNRKSLDQNAKAQQMSKERQFYRHSVNDVLKFAVEWTDLSPGGEVHSYTLNYYLSDNCAEICTVPQPGYDHFPLLLSRQPLPLNWEDVAQRGAKPVYAGIEDLVVGKTVEVYNRLLRVVDCSEYTRQWYHLNLNLVQGCLTSPPKSPSAAAAAAAASQMNGFSENNSTVGDPFLRNEPAVAAMTAKLSSYFDKSTAQPHNDHARDFRVAGKSVRCRLQLCDRKGNIRRESSVTTTASATATLDQPRSFILTYYLPDRSLGIYEEHIPNSGVLGGTFLKRGRYRTTPLEAKAPRFFRSSDFYLGAVLVISAHNVMKIVEVDGASFKIMQQCSDEFPFADSKKVTKKFLNNLRDNAPAPLRAMFSHAQVRNDVYQGAIAEDDFIPIVDAHGLCGGLNSQEKLTLAATFRAHVAGGTRPYFTDVHRLCDTLCFQHSTAPGTHDLEEVDMDEVAVGAASSVETTQDAQPPGPEFVAQLAHVPVLFRKSFEVAAAKNPTGHLITMPQLAAVLEKSGVKIHDEHFAFLEEQFGNPVDFNALCDAAYFADFAL